MLSVLRPLLAVGALFAIRGANSQEINATLGVGTVDFTSSYEALSAWDAAGYTITPNSYDDFLITARVAVLKNCLSLDCLTNVTDDERDAFRLALVNSFRDDKLAKRQLTAQAIYTAVYKTVPRYYQWVVDKGGRTCQAIAQHKANQAQRSLLTILLAGQGALETVAGYTGTQRSTYSWTMTLVFAFAYWASRTRGVHRVGPYSIALYHDYHDPTIKRDGAAGVLGTVEMAQITTVIYYRTQNGTTTIMTGDAMPDFGNGLAKRSDKGNTQWTNGGSNYNAYFTWEWGNNYRECSAPKGYDDWVNAVQDSAYSLWYAGSIPFLCTAPFDSQGNPIMSGVSTIDVGIGYDFNGLDLQAFCTNEFASGFGIKNFKPDDTKAC